MTIKVGRLKEVLEDVLNELESYDDNDLVKTYCNTYGLSSHFISLGSNGFVDLYGIIVEEDEDEDED